LRDGLANELADLYPASAQKLVELLARVVVNDREIDYINSRALPIGADRLLAAELQARGLPWVTNNVETPRIANQLTLPPWPRGSNATEKIVVPAAHRQWRSSSGRSLANHRWRTETGWCRIRVNRCG
jgi:hypothetical protein